MKIGNVGKPAVGLALLTLVTMCLTGCSGSSGGAAQETDAQKTKREAAIQQHKDAADNVR